MPSDIDGPYVSTTRVQPDSQHLLTTSNLHVVVAGVESGSHAGGSLHTGLVLYVRCHSRPGRLVAVVVTHDGQVSVSESP